MVLVLKRLHILARWDSTGGLGVSDQYQSQEDITRDEWETFPEALTQLHTAQKDSFVCSTKHHPATIKIFTK